MYIPDVLNTLLMGLIFMVIVVTVVRPIMLNMLTGNANPQDMQRALIESVQAHVQRATQEVASQRTGKIRYQQLLLELPERRQPLVLPAPPVAVEAGAEPVASSDVPGVDATTAASGDLTDGAAASNADDVSMASGSEANADAPSSDLAPGEIEIAEGESLHDIKERIKREKKNAAKPTIPPELLNGAKSYEDKVGVVRMVVHQDQSRVAAVIRGMIEVK
jgi:hypothetical protein